MTGDDVESAVKRVQEAVSAFEEAPSMETAAAAEWKLSVMKILVGPERFDSLPAFARAL